MPSVLERVRAIKIVIPTRDQARCFTQRDKLQLLLDAPLKGNPRGWIGHQSGRLLSFRAVASLRRLGLVSCKQAGAKPELTEKGRKELGL